MDLSNKKILIRTKELLEKTSISRATLSFWIFQLKRGGRDLREMGCYQLKGCRYDLWNLNEFISYLENERLDVRAPNNKHEAKRIREALLLVKTNNQHEGVNL